MKGMLTRRLFGLSVSLVIAAGLGAPAAAQTGQVYTADNAHSLMDFTARLLGFNRVRGTFATWSADLTYDPAALDRSSVSFIADATSISTGVGERDADLKGATFFDVAHFPRITFRSTSVAAAAGGFVVTGDLTIRDSTRHVRLPVQVIAPPSTDPFGKQRVSFGTSVSLNRRDFGVIGPAFWNRAIADSIVVEIELGARVWDFSQIGWGTRPGRRSVGELLYAAADSGRLSAGLAHARALWAARQSDTTWSFSWWELEKAAMRLAQRGRLPDAQRILDLAVEVHQGGPSDELAELLARRGEVRIRLGHHAEAAEDLRQALQLDPGNTNAMEWQRLTGG